MLVGKEESTNAPFKIGILSAPAQSTTPPARDPVALGAAGSRPGAPSGAKSSQKKEGGLAKAKDREALPSKEKNEMKGKLLVKMMGAICSSQQPNFARSSLKGPYQ